MAVPSAQGCSRSQADSKAKIPYPGLRGSLAGFALQLTHWGQNTLYSSRTRLNPKGRRCSSPPIKEEIQMRNHRCRLWESPLMSQEWSANSVRSQCECGRTRAQGLNPLLIFPPISSIDSNSAPVYIPNRDTCRITKT